MRFYDFISDINETSARIATRKAYLDQDTTVSLTIKTLMRPDVIAFFDELRQPYDHDLTANQTLLYYIFMYAYVVNIKPRPVYRDLSAISEKVAKILNQSHLSSEDGIILCASSKLKLPEYLMRHLQAWLNLDNHKGLFCHYTAQPPREDILKGVLDTRSKDAALLLYSGNSIVLSENNKNNSRIIYSGSIFTSEKYHLSGIYIQSLY